MKIWRGYGSEHSANLVMIGKFKDSASAKEAKAIIDQLTKQVQADIDANRMKVGERSERFTEGMLALFRTLNTWSINAMELEQFAYEISVSVEGNQLEISTDESDVSAFLKIMFDNEARIEVYSAHVYGSDGKPKP